MNPIAMVHPSLLGGPSRFQKQEHIWWLGILGWKPEANMKAKFCFCSVALALHALMLGSSFVQNAQQSPMQCSTKVIRPDNKTRMHHAVAGNNNEKRDKTVTVHERVQ
jgi:hypothetical protein